MQNFKPTFQKQRHKNKKVFDWKKIILFGLIWKGFEQKRYDWKE